MDSIATARERIDGNVAPALALEAMLVIDRARLSASLNAIVNKEKV